MVKHITAQINAATLLQPAKATPVARAPRTASQQPETRQEPATGQRDTAKEQPRPPGHRARYAVAQGGGLLYAGHKFIADDLTDNQKDTLTRAAVSVGVQPYQ